MNGEEPTSTATAKVEAPVHQDAGLSPLKRALLAIEDLTARLDAARGAQRQPIAIVGLACRFPGGANDPAAFWELLREGRDGVADTPADRWDVDAFYDPDPGVPGRMYSRAGGYLDQPVDRFDAGFFEIAPREALSMDPQQRLLLELTWESLEHSGIAPESLAGSRTGVFVGISTTDYAMRGSRLGGASRIDTYSGTGNAFSVAAGRISYLLGLQGPNLALDTACSSSLVAVALGVQSLRDGQSDLALVGGVNLILSPETSIGMSKLRALAPDGRCKSFAAGADGYVRGEGGGVIVLKRLSDALSAGDVVHAVIRGVAVNHGGRSSGLTVPSAESQRAVMRAALADASCAPDQVDYLEAHGTGTDLGDPIELRSIDAVFGPGRQTSTPLFVGSVKTNVGHLEAAAGMAGLIKVVLGFREEGIPPHLHFERPTPHFDWSKSPIAIPDSLIPWPRGERARVAGISSFGFSGTNAHIVVEEAPRDERPGTSVDRPLHVLGLSARRADDLRTLAERYRDFLSNGAAQPSDVCHTAATGRNHFDHRFALVGSRLEDFRDGLDRFLRDPDACTLHTRDSPAPRARGVAFLFGGLSGRRSPSPGIGRELYHTQPVFRDLLDQCDGIARAASGRSLIPVLMEDAHENADASRGGWTEPAYFALQYALAQLWRSWGIEPKAVLGHGAGEYVAACVAGAFSVEDGIRLLLERERVADALPAPAEAVRVFADEARVRGVLEGLDGIHLTGLDGPGTVTIGGTPGAVVDATGRLRAAGIRHRPLAAAVGWHSPMVEPLHARVADMVSGLRFADTSIALVSTLTGAVVGRGDLARREHWTRQMTEAVRFRDAMTAIGGLGCDTFLQVAPGAELLSLGRRCLADEQATWLPTLPFGRAEWAAVLESLAALYIDGARPDWNAFDAPYARRKVSLPTYPFRRERYWLNAAPASEDTGTAGRSASHVPADRHPLLVARLRSPALSDVVYESSLSGGCVPLLRDHQVFDIAVFPTTGYMEAALAAVGEAFGWSACELTNLEIRAPLVLAEEVERSFQVILTATAQGIVRVRFVSASATPDPDSTWTTHATAEVREQVVVSGPQPAMADEARARCERRVDVEDLYERFAAAGIRYGPSFRAIEAAWQGPGEAVGRLRLPRAGAESEHYRLHPGLLDSCLQLIAVAVAGLGPGGESTVLLPAGLERGRFSGLACSGGWGLIRVQGDPADTATFRADVQLLDDHGLLVADIVGIRFVAATRDAMLRFAPVTLDEWRHGLAWRPAPAETAVDVARIAQGNWLILTDEGGVGAEMAARLRTRGSHVVFASRAEGFENLPDHRYAVRPDNPDDLARVVADLYADGRPCAGVLYLWGLDEQPAPATGHLDGLEVSQRTLVGGLLHLVQGLDGSGREDVPQLWVVTRDAQCVGDDARSVPLGSASVWGLGRTIALELPRLRTVMIDLGHDIDDPVGAIERELRGGAEGENQVALRSAGRFALRLTLRAGDRGGSSSHGTLRSTIRPDATYLVTGGLGGLGLTAAEWLVAQGARRLVLLARRPPSTSAVRLIARMEALGAEVIAVQADVSRREELEPALQAHIPADMPLRGVIHAAGALDDAVLASLDLARLDSVAAPKVAGAWNLHCATIGQPLDFFVLFSSAASILGSAGQANYAAANAFMDGLAHHRRGLGLTATTVNWGRWSDVGMAADLDAATSSRAAASGFRSLTPETGCQLLGSLRPALDTQVCMVSADWAALFSTLPTGTEPPILADLRRAVGSLVEPEADTRIRRRIETAEEADRREILVEYLERTVAAVMGIGEGRLEASAALASWGFDSLMALEVRNRLEHDLRVAMPTAVLLTTPTIAALAAEIIERIDVAEEDDARARPSLVLRARPLGSDEETILLQQIDDLSDDRVDALLEELSRKVVGG